jgi:hypothetical protein
MENNTVQEDSGSKKTPRRLVLAAAGMATAALGLGATPANAAPNGTRPTILTVTSVVSVNATTMRITGTLSDLNGSPLSGLKVDIYSVFVASFTRWSTVYTNNGVFTTTCAKVPVGAKIQVVVDGNGAYSQPFNTYNRV